MENLQEIYSTCLEKVIDDLAISVEFAAKLLLLSKAQTKAFIKLSGNRHKLKNHRLRSTLNLDQAK